MGLACCVAYLGKRDSEDGEDDETSHNEVEGDLWHPSVATEWQPIPLTVAHGQKLLKRSPSPSGLPSPSCHRVGHGCWVVGRVGPRVGKRRRGARVSYFIISNRLYR